MNEDLRTSAAGLEIIKNFEGFRAKAYICPAGVLTIGYGTTSSVHRGQVVNESQATALLARDVVSFEREIKRSVKVPLEQHEFDALVSFVYNVGPGNFRSSTLLKRLNASAFQEVPAQMMRWNKGGGRVLEGLNRRRAAEGRLFSSGRAGL